MPEAKITITAIDEASDKLNKIYDSVKRMEQGQKAAGDSSNFLKSNLDGLATSLTGMSFTTLGMTVALAGFVKQSAFAADEMNAVHNRAEALFGSDFPKMIAQSEDLANQFGRNAS